MNDYINSINQNKEKEQKMVIPNRKRKRNIQIINYDKTSSWAVETNIIKNDIKKRVCVDDDSSIFQNIFEETK